MTQMHALNKATTASKTSKRASCVWRLVRRFARWYHGEEPQWYMHRQWTLDGKILNALATAYARCEETPPLLAPERAAGRHCFTCDHWTWRTPTAGRCAKRREMLTSKDEGCEMHSSPNTSMTERRAPDAEQPNGA